MTKAEGGGQARYESLADEARVVRQVFAWVGGDRLTIGEVCRRLTPAGERTRTGTTVWDRRVGWGILKNPASQGAAVFGKTRLEPLRPRLRAQRHRPVPPRRAVSVSAVPPEDGLPLPVPALVAPEVGAAVEEQLREHKRHAWQSRRGALYLRHGLLPCQQCGDAFYGQRRRPSARKGQPRASASYRCRGTAAYRVGGERLCQKTPVRSDLLALAVWQAVCTLRTHPERRVEEYRRRWQPAARAKRTPLASIDDQSSKGRQGVARLIDSEAESLIDQAEFEPRMTRRRPRLAQWEEQRQALAEAAALQGELRLIIGRLEDYATTLHDGLEAADWASKRDRIRALVKRSADDFVTTAPTREVLETYARPRIEQFLQERGLALNASKTRIVHIKEGLNFLGFHIRKFWKQWKWLTVPHKEKILKHVRATRAYLDAHKQTPAGQGIKALNPIRRGWANYDRYCAAKHVFQKVRHAQWQMLWKWAKRRHPNKSRKWVKTRYCRDDG